MNVIIGLVLVGFAHWLNAWFQVYEIKIVKRKSKNEIYS